METRIEWMQSAAETRLDKHYNSTDQSPFSKLLKTETIIYSINIQAVDRTNVE